jgi:hypothetical protein
MARKSKSRRNCLFLNTGRAEVSITNEKGEPVLLEEAKRLWESGSLNDYNLALRRFASLDWNYEALKAYYAKGGRP